MRLAARGRGESSREKEEKEEEEGESGYPSSFNKEEGRGGGGEVLAGQSGGYTLLTGVTTQLGKTAMSPSCRSIGGIAVSIASCEPLFLFNPLRSTSSR